MTSFAPSPTELPLLRADEGDGSPSPFSSARKAPCQASRNGLYRSGERLQDDGLCREAPGARRMGRRQSKLLAHVHPAIEPESEIERVEHESVRCRLEIAEFGREPRGKALAQQLAQLSDTEADCRHGGAHALGEVPYREPFLEQFRAIRDQKVDAVRQRRAAVDRTRAVEGSAHRKIEGRGVEIGKAGEMLEECAAGNTGYGRDCGGRRLDVACLDEVQGRLDQRMASAKPTHDTAVLRPRDVNREANDLHPNANANMSAFNQTTVETTNRPRKMQKRISQRLDTLILLHCLEQDRHFWVS